VSAAQWWIAFNIPRASQVRDWVVIILGRDDFVIITQSGWARMKSGACQFLRNGTRSIFVQHGDHRLALYKWIVRLDCQ
jgi:hypothetical protein